jgi:hypothetical protein
MFLTQRFAEGCAEVTEFLGLSFQLIPTQTEMILLSFIATDSQFALAFLAAALRKIFELC